MDFPDIPAFLDRRLPKPAILPDHELRERDAGGDSVPGLPAPTGGSDELSETVDLFERMW